MVDLWKQLLISLEEDLDPLVQQYVNQNFMKISLSATFVRILVLLPKILLSHQTKKTLFDMPQDMYLWH